MELSYGTRIWAQVLFRFITIAYDRQTDRRMDL